LTHKYPRVKNFNVAVKEWQNQIIFFHKLVPGGANKSYGIQVARLAGLPREVIERAKEILAHLEDGGISNPTLADVEKRRSRPRKGKETGVQLSLFKPSAEWLRERILALDLDNITPVAALQTLYALREQIGSRERVGENK
jgi:DNA mismatch repair protein MutS